MKEKIIIIIEIISGVFNIFYGFKFNNFYITIIGLLFILFGIGIFIYSDRIKEYEKIIKRQEKTIKEILKIGDYNNG